LSEVLEIPSRDDPDWERKMAEGFGLDALPVPKYDDLPEGQDNAEAISELVNFRKAVSIVDPIMSAAFWPYLSDALCLDQHMDTRTFKRGCSFAVVVPAFGAMPVNQKIAAATGVGFENNFKNRCIWMAQELLWHYRYFGARRISPPLVYLAGHEGVVGSTQGVIFQLDRTPPDGMTETDIMAQLGILIDADTRCENRVVAVGTATPEDAALLEVLEPGTSSTKLT
jgi:hypothetical protein